MSKRSRESHARLEFDDAVDGNHSLAEALETELRHERQRAQIAEAALRRAQAAVAFAGRVLKEHRNDGMPDDVDGAWLQETALACGLLVQREMDGPCMEEACACAEVNSGWPVTCFFLSETGAEAIRAADETEGNAHAA
ncbi:hypothetical protein [Paraburkholderia sp. MM6662-R1]|uniref:hypothetical protein n=1 Tax=Paraburkholderia sp. MM6662-R1 TaxID=2991066 RepID=UPI003D193BBF